MAPPPLFFCRCGRDRHTLYCVTAVKADLQHSHGGQARVGRTLHLLILLLCINCPWTSQLQESRSKLGGDLKCVGSTYWLDLNSDSASGVKCIMPTILNFFLWASDTIYSTLLTLRIEWVNGDTAPSNYDGDNCASLKWVWQTGLEKVCRVQSEKAVCPAKVSLSLVTT